MHRIVCDLCKQTAQDQETTNYANVARAIGMSTFGEGWRYQIGPLLDEVSRHEHAQGRPLLSVVVVREDTLRPGEGLFTLARELGRSVGLNDEEFFIKELKAAHAAWKR